jgi:amidase
LDAGADIKGKLNMESFAISAVSETSDFGTVTNPRAPEYTTGGSSSGSGAAVAADEVDIAIGCDQGGSIRIPSSFCGIIGLKPTTGLIPYTGIFPIDNSIDHVGPMATSVEDIAVALEVMAGTDGLDPRQPDEIPQKTYQDALKDDISNMTIAVLDEGFAHEENEPEVNSIVKEAIDELEQMGANVEHVSIPEHLESHSIFWPIAGYGVYQTLTQEGTGSLYDGWYDTHLAKTFAKFRRSRSNEFSAEVKTVLIAWEYLQQQSQDYLYGKAQNLSLKLRKEYDTVLEEADAIAMPTSPITPPKIDDDLGRVERIHRKLPISKNTCVFDITHHPAISIPCGTLDDLPIGLMLVGSRWEEEVLLQISYTFEQNTEYL